MRHLSLFIKVTCGLVLLWVGVFSIQALVAPYQATPELVNRLIQEANFADYSQATEVSEPKEQQRRQKAMQELAAIVNRLDLSAQELTREPLELFWDRLAAQERREFMDLTMESFRNIFAALDALTPEARKQFLERGLRELADSEKSSRLKEMIASDPDLMQQIAQQGMKAYFQNASSETKMNFTPFFKATSEVLQGIRGQPFQGGPKL